MNKQHASLTQQMWKDYPNAKFWLETIAEPAKHMVIRDNKIVSVDWDYAVAVESLSYILSGEQKNVSLTTKDDEKQKNG